jgi:hypothetical protein
MNLRGIDFQGLAILVGGVVVVGVVAYIAHRVIKGGAALGEAVGEGVALVNPADDRNIVNRGVTAAVSAATGRDETLGGWLAGIFNPASRQAERINDPVVARARAGINPVIGESVY